MSNSDLELLCLYGMLIGLYIIVSSVLDAIFAKDQDTPGGENGSIGLEAAKLEDNDHDYKS